MRELQLRILSACILIPIGVGSAYYGGLILGGVLSILALTMIIEWQGMMHGMKLGKSGDLPLKLGLWSFGLVYVIAPMIAFYFIRQSDQGLWRSLLVLVAVWTTDIAAYLAGRGFGGPKVSPKHSPAKTWSGSLGAMLCAGLAGAALANFVNADRLFWGGAAIMLSVIAQLGDLFESRLKRYFGVKDSGRLIPGHGGMMDRLDALMAASVFAAIVIWLSGNALPPLGP